MRIAVLGWGSLINMPTKRDITLEIKDNWFNDGPMLPIEYARISGSKELTLVIFEEGKIVQTLWAYSSFNNLDEAISNLREREGIPLTAMDKIGCVSIPDNEINSQFQDIAEKYIKSWALDKKIDAVIWTDLSENFMDKYHDRFSEDNAIDYLKNLNDIDKEKVKNYIQITPPQIKTRLRKRIKEEFEW